MKEAVFHTKAGLLSGVISERMDKDGILRSCRLEKKNRIFFHGEIYIPNYGCEDFRKRYRDAVTFYKSGNLKSLYLEEQQEVNSPVGKMKAELVSFYESGRIRRIFPVYGQISGYWSESEEAVLLPSCEITVARQRIKAKISCLSFYESGALKSVTLWPGESIEIYTPAGKIKTRYGISFYENGSIESVEPDIPVIVSVNTCQFFAYDSHPIGIHGDKNSLAFYEDGTLKALKTTITAVIVTCRNEKIRFEPESRISPTDIESKEIVPLILNFNNKILSITDSDAVVHDFLLDQTCMITEQIPENLFAPGECTACSDCGKCGHSKH